MMVQMTGAGALAAMMAMDGRRALIPGDEELWLLFGPTAPGVVKEALLAAPCDGDEATSFAWSLAAE